MPHLDGAKAHDARTKEDTVPYAGVALPFARPTPTESDVMQDRHVVTDLGRLANDNPSCVVYHDAPSQFCSRVYVHVKQFRNSTLQGCRKGISLLLPKPVRNPIRLYCLKTFEVEHAVRVFFAGRVSIKHGVDVCHHRIHNFLVLRKSLFKKVEQVGTSQRVALQLVCEHKCHCFLERIVHEDGGMEDAGQRRLKVRILLGLLTDFLPELIHAFVMVLRLICLSGAREHVVTGRQHRDWVPM
mmetsp:Transcript_20871/g.37259  ORF Transcript_20871/g.37259 Transcript_20871/m.37259 type:complete len:242 (+) Transcript_20871:407-1132(+)